MDWLKEITRQIELHSPEGIRNCFAHGIGPNDDFKDRPLIEELISEYTRSPRFKDCVQVFVDHGLRFEDEALLAVILNKADTLESFLRGNPTLVSKKHSFRCAYTPMHEVTLLHICAEFNHLACAEVLVNYNVDINSKAGYDEYGFGGQTAIFHTVNQNGNQSASMLDFLLSNDADLRVTVPGLIWGKGYEWETLIPAVNPVSYAMMGLLPQMHRDERTIAKTVTILLKKAYGIEYSSENIPNTYLKKGL